MIKSIRSATRVFAALMIANVLPAQETQPAQTLMPFASPEVIGLCPSTSGVAVITSCGVVHFFDVGTGDHRRAVSTGVAGWRRVGEGSVAGYEFPAQVRGGPVTVVGETVLAVDDLNRLLRFDPTGRMTVVREDELLEGATVVCPVGKDGAVLVGTRSGRLCSVLPEKALAGPSPLAEPVLVLAVAPNAKWCLSAGIGPYWHVRALESLALTKNAGNHIGEEFIHDIVVSKDSNHVAVAHGYSTCRIKGFSVEPDGIVKDFDAFKKGGDVSTTLAYDESTRLLVAGDESGAVRVFPSGIGDGSNLPRSTVLAGEGSGPIASSSVDLRTGKSLLVSDLGSWRVDREPIRGVCFADADQVIISVNRAGEVVARSWPSGAVKWTKRVPYMCQADGVVSVTPRLLNFGKNKATETRAVLVEKSGSTADLKIERVASSPPGVFTTKVEEVTPGQVYRIVIGFGPEARPGCLRGTTTIKTNAAGQEDLAVHFYAILIE